jgi:hypothetical protein
VPGHASLLGYSRRNPARFRISAKPVLAGTLILAHRILPFAVEFHQNIFIFDRRLVFPTRVVDVTLVPSSWFESRCFSGADAVHLLFCRALWHCHD